MSVHAAKPQVNQSFSPLAAVKTLLLFCCVVCLCSAAGLNYCAVLDIAADVAKAMLHLHSLNVLHADLKVRKRSHCHQSGLTSSEAQGDLGLGAAKQAQISHSACGMRT